MTIIRCIGCGRIIGENVHIRGSWAYTCSCGANLFSFDGKIAMPRSLIAYIAYKKYGESSPFGEVKSIPHIEYYLGYSEYMDDIKKDAIEGLRILGSISGDECQDLECIKEKDRQVAMLQEAISENDDYWRKLTDDQLAAHFHVPIAKVRKIKKYVESEIR